MNKRVNINLSEVPVYDAHVVVTTNKDGEPLSHVYDLNWDFSGMETRAVGKSQFVPFSDIDDKYRKAIQSTLVCILNRFQEKWKKTPTRVQVDNWRKGLVSISRIKGDCDWASLSDDRVFSSFKSKLTEYYKGTPPSESALSGMLKGLRKLNEYKFCQRHFSLKELKETIYVREVQQYIAIPIKMYQPIISKAIEIIELYHPHRFKINELMLQAHTIRTTEINNPTGSESGNSLWSDAYLRLRKNRDPSKNEISK